MILNELSEILKKYDFCIKNEHQTLIFNGNNFEFIQSSTPSIFCAELNTHIGTYLPEINSIIITKKGLKKHEKTYTIIEEYVHAIELDTKGITRAIQSLNQIKELQEKYKQLRFNGKSNNEYEIQTIGNNEIDNIKRTLIKPLEQEHGLVKGISLLLFKQLIPYWQDNYEELKKENDKPEYNIGKTTYNINELLNKGLNEIIQSLKQFNNTTKEINYNINQ